MLLLEMPGTCNNMAMRSPKGGKSKNIKFFVL
jgi:hypothetical protein